MKVCIVGSGSQGTGLAGLLAKEADVESILLIDYSEEVLKKAKELILSLGDNLKAKEISTKTADASDVNSLSECMKGYDIVFNATIPRFNIPIMKACIKAKANYLDLFAAPYEGEGISYNETIDAQFDLNEEFEKIGKIALPCIGISPGWTSLVSQYYIDKMEEVDKVIIRFADEIDCDTPITGISPLVTLQEFLGSPYPLRTENGKPNAVDLLESREDFEFPEPLGIKSIYTVTAQPDIALIPKFAGKHINICEEKGGIYTGHMTMEEMWIKSLQAATSKQGSNKENCNILERCASYFVAPIEYSTLLKKGEIKEHAVCFSCEVSGKEDGKYVKHIVYYLSTLKEAQKHLPWGSPAVYGTAGGLPIELVLAIGRGEINAVGVKPIGELNMAQRILDSLKERGHIILEKTIR